MEGSNLLVLVKYVDGKVRGKRKRKRKRVGFNFKIFGCKKG